jgi:small neutral amino acid transporter SnatA (MarC family)
MKMQLSIQAAAAELFVLVTTLFTGQLSSQHLTLPVNRTKIRPGTFLIRVLLNDKVMLTGNRLVFNQ